MAALIEFFLKRSIFGNLLTLLIITWGGYVALTINREAFPKIDFDIVVVTTVYPGASPAEVEKLITIPIEEELKSVDGIEEIRSSSIDNRSGITIKIDPDVGDVKKVVEDIRSAVDRVTNLPEDAETPLVLEISSSLTPVIEICLEVEVDELGRPVLSYRQLRDEAEKLEDSLLLLDEVARVQRKGWRDAEFHVLLDPDRLAANYIGLESVLLALKERNINFPGGEVILNERSKNVRTVGELQTADDIASVYIRSNDAGQGIRISSVGSVRPDFAPVEYIERTNGRPSINLTVIKRSNADIIKTVAKVHEIVDRYSKTKPAAIHIAYVNDVSYYVKRRLGVLLSNAIGGLVLVVGSLFFFMGWRTSLMVALGIPISIAISFIIMNFLGVTLNLISMFGMIIVIGILVDDAIVISENFYRMLEQGYRTYEAALKGTAEVVLPVFASVFTTMVSFAPLMFMTGIFGKFVFTIPLVVIITLASSLFESIFILPSHLYDANKFSQHAGEIREEGSRFYRFRTACYEPLLAWALRKKLFVLAGLFVLLFASIALFALFGKFKLFPGAVEQIHVRMVADPSTPLEQMDRYTVAVSRVLERFPKNEIENFTTRAGIIQQNTNDPFTRRGYNYAQAMIYLTPESKRKRTDVEIIDQLRDEISWMLNEGKRRQMEAALPPDPRRKRYSPYQPPGTEDLAGSLKNLDIDVLRGGPPVGKPVAIEITGKDYDKLEEIGERFKAILATYEGVKDIDDDHEPGKEEVRLFINEAVAARAGVSVQSVALAVNTALSGARPTSIKQGTEEVDIRVRFNDAYYKKAETLNRIKVLNRTGQLIPLSRLVRFDRGQGVVALNHLDTRRLVTVTASVDEKITSSARVNRLLASKLPEIMAEYPGYQARLGGENKDTEESLASLRKAFAVGFVINFMVLASLFRSVLLPFVILFTIPFSLIGVLLAFLLHGQPLSFISLLGIVGLSGVVANDSIVLIDFAISLLQEDPEMPLDEVALQAGSMRLRAVILTTLTTVLGLLPTAYGIGGYDPFLVPMALAFAWGLLFATFLTLFVIPILFVLAVSFVRWLKRALGLREH
jgi:multidrug efflux pump subunit AcrB